MKKPVFFFISFIIFLSFPSCEPEFSWDNWDNQANYYGTASQGTFGADVEITQYTISGLMENNKNYHDKDDDYVFSIDDAIKITLNENSISAGSSTVNVDGNIATITQGGSYVIAGSISDGQIIVNSEDEETVKLILNGVNMYCSSSAPIYISNADRTVIILADNSTNILEDGTEYVYDSVDMDEPNATIFSKYDLTIFGNGSLQVKANYNDGISSKDGLTIAGGNITIDATDDGIRGKDYVFAKAGNITISAQGDGIKSDNEEDTTKGYVFFKSGYFDITSSGDAISAQTDLLIEYAEISITTAGGSSKNINETLSAKGIKSEICTVVEGGTFSINAADDAIHSNKHISITSGTFTISSADDGIHADLTLGIYGGTINIEKSYEGIEAKNAILVNSGNIWITSSDDGVNVAGKGDMMQGGPNGYGGSSSSGSYYLYIDGGYMVVNAQGDGLDVNGSIVMTNGTVLVHGPTGNGNGALDYDGGFKVNGGLLAAAGSSGMAMAPSASSEQNSILVYFSSTQKAENMTHIENSDKNEILCFEPCKTYQSLVFSSPNLSEGGSYTIYLGGTSSKSATDGLYENGGYSAGSKYTSFSISDVVTSIR